MIIFLIFNSLSSSLCVSGHCHGQRLKTCLVHEAGPSDKTKNALKEKWEEF